MINKEELLNILENARRTEEEVIAVYAKHLRAVASWEGLGVEQEHAEKIIGNLRILAEDSSRHKRTVEYLIEEVTKEGKDVY